MKSWLGDQHLNEFPLYVLRGPTVLDYRVEGESVTYPRLFQCLRVPLLLKYRGALNDQSERPMAGSIRGDVKNIFLPPPEARL